jgi:3',5'-cyclic AMP phosphodiesterase CpdA
MRTIAHLSDLHFGRVDARLLSPLARALEDARPDVVAISGDLTQRARTGQFRQAAAYLRTLPTPQIVVPGNHDVPLYDVVRRFFSPLARFRRYVSAEVYPYYHDEEIAVLGLNTARSLTFKGGRVNRQQVNEVARRFAGLAEPVTRIVVTHHPFDLPSGGKESDLVGRSTMAMAAFSDCGVDLFLSGHLHHTHAGTTAQRYRINGFAALVIQAGTATSVRSRDEVNAFNLIRIGSDAMTLTTWRWRSGEGRFTASAPQAFAYVSGSGWAPVEHAMD